MANKDREKLENQAAEYGIDPKGLDDKEIQELITEAKNAEKEQAAEDVKQRKADYSKDTRFFKTPISGLSLQLSENEDRTVVGVDEVRFSPYSLWNDARGENIKFGLLTTDDPNVHELCEQDLNVKEITEKEYSELIETAKPVPY